MKVSLKNLVWFTYLFTALYSYTKLTEIVSFLSITKYIQLGLIAILLISTTIRQSISTKSLFLMIILLGAAIVELSIIGDVTVVFYIVFIFCTKNLDCDEFIKTDMLFKCGFILAVTSVCLIGLIENYTMVRPDGSLRYAMGFNHPNSFAGIVISVLLEWMCMKIQKTIRFRHVVWIVLMVAIVDWLTNSRTFELSMIITLILTYVFIKAKNSKLINAVFIGMPFFLSILSFGIVLLYDRSNSNWVMIDTFVSNRISFAQNFIMEYKLRLWGQNLNLVGSIQALITSENTHILDMGYLRFVLQYGLIFSILLIAIIMIDMSYAMKKKNVTMIVLLTFLCVSAVFESTLGNPIYNYIIPIVTTGVLSNMKKDRSLRKESRNLEC